MPIDYVESSIDGSFKLDNLPLDQEFRLYVNHDAYTHKWENIAVLTHAERQRELNLALDPKPAGGSIAGKVTTPAGEPIAGAIVTHSGTSSRDIKTATTDQTGAYRLDGIQPRSDLPNQIVARAAGWAPVAVEFQRMGSADTPAELNIQMVEKGHRISGRLINDKGEPIKGARVEAGHFTAGDDQGVLTTTDEEGRFRFDTLRSRATFDFSAQGYSGIDWLELPLNGEDEVTIIMQRAGTIVGKVIDADTGSPLARFNIRTEMSGISANRFEIGEDFGGGTGEFRLDDLRVGEKAMLIVSAAGYPKHYFERIPPTPGGDGEPVILRISKNPAGYHRIAGRIIDSNGKSIEGVEVRALSYRESDRGFPQELQFRWGMIKSGQINIQDYIRAVESTRTSADGTFALPSIPGPDVDLVYWGERVPQTRMRNIATMSAEQLSMLELRVASPATVAGRINKQVYPSIGRLTLRSTEDPTFEIELTVKDDQTRYEFPAVPAGSYGLHTSGPAVRARNGGFQYPIAATIPVTVAEGTSVELDLGFDRP